LQIEYRFDRIQNTSCFTQHYTDRTGYRRKYVKLSIGADVLKQIIYTITIRRAPTRYDDNIDFKPIITKTSDILPLSVVTADKGYDEDNHLLVRDGLPSSLYPCTDMENTW